MRNFVLLIIMLIVFSIMFQGLVYDDVLSIPMLLIMFICNILLCAQINRSFKREFQVYLFFIYIVFVSCCHWGTFRLSTILYLMLFLFTFIFYTRLVMKSEFTLKHYLKVIRFLIYAYTIVLVLQQLCVFINIPILNIANYEERNPYKLNSLALEPEHASRIMAILLFSFIKMRELILGYKYTIKNIVFEDRIIWGLSVYFFLTNGSVLAYIVLALILFYFFSIRNLKWVVSFCILFVCAIISLSDKYFVFKRLTLLSKAFITFDPQTIIDVDASAAARIVPWFWYFQDLDLLSIKTWFGHGIDFSAQLYSLYYLGDSEKNSGFVGGFFPGYILDMGILAFILFLPILKNYCLNRWWSMEMLIWVILINTSPINSYLFWFGMFMLFTNKYFNNLLVYENRFYTCPSDKSIE